jgi:murein DD-endopeptidase MepM/ murein hydrolase activator NlpD
MYGASGVPIYATLEGIVDEVETEPSRGLGVGIVSQEKYETTEGEYQIKHRYWHLKSIAVSKGQKIEVGDLIGTCDNTGYSSGDHLHFETKQVANGKNVFQNNGYYGAFNCEPYFDGTYANPQFLVDMKLGDKNEEVKRLQQYLKNLGYFTYPECTGYYGNVTREAVFLFQQENIELSWYERYVLKGKTVGPKTRAALNKL